MPSSSSTTPTLELSHHSGSPIQHTNAIEMVESSNDHSLDTKDSIAFRLDTIHQVEPSLSH